MVYKHYQQQPFRCAHCTHSPQKRAVGEKKIYVEYGKRCGGEKGVHM